MKQLFKKLVCLFKGHDHPEMEDHYWSLMWEGKEAERMEGRMCMRCLNFRVDSWFRIGDCDELPTR